MGRKNYEILIIIFLAILTGCVKDTPNAVVNTSPTGAGNVYVVCEGNFGTGNASLYAYNPTSDSVFGDLYKNANANLVLGDVFQSMAKINGHFFLCINNSDKVLVIDATTYQLLSTISIPKPRYILEVGSNKAYISTLYSNKVYVINTLTYAILGTINLPTQNSEGMCLYNNQAVITSWDTAGRAIYLVDAGTDAIIKTIPVAGIAPQEVLIDKDQLLWVLAGNQPEGKTATWSKIDPSTGLILASFIFPTTCNPVRPVFNNTKDTLYFIEADYYGGTANNGIYRMSIYAQNLPTQAFIPAQQYQYFWALGIAPTTGNIYVGDPKGFTQKGIVYIYRPDGTVIKKFNVGLGPGHFYFDR